jgi:hypothetical protein
MYKDANTRECIEKQGMPAQFYHGQNSHKTVYQILSAIEFFSLKRKQCRLKHFTFQKAYFQFKQHALHQTPYIK